MSLEFLIVVIVYNAINLDNMLWVFYMEKSDFVVTLGDGTASFLECREPATEKYCVFSKAAIIAEVSHRRAKEEALQGLLHKPSPSSDEERQHNASGTPKVDHFEELVLNSSGIWRDQKHLISSALGKDREVGSSFMCVKLLRIV